MVLLCLCILDMFVAFFTSENAFWANKSKTVILSDFLFIEGIIIFSIGALVASGISVLRMERWQSLYASPNGHVKYLRQERRKQFSFGIVLMIIGAVLTGLSIAIYFFLG